MQTVSYHSPRSHICIYVVSEASKGALAWRLRFRSELLSGWLHLLGNVIEEIVWKEINANHIVLNESLPENRSDIT